MAKSLYRNSPGRYRLGTTSYIYPAPVLPNARRLAGRVQDIELVFFEYNVASGLPSPEEIPQIKQLAEENDLTFTVHLPLDLSLGDRDILVRDQSIDKARKIIELTRPLNPWGYIIHPDRWGSNADEGFFPFHPLPNNCSSLKQLNSEDKERVNCWADRVLKGFHTLSSFVAEPSNLCLENTNFLFDYLLPSFLSSPFGICLDIGHLLQSGLNVMPYLQRCFGKLRIIHLYGVGKGHQPLNRGMSPLLTEMFNYLNQNNYCGVVTLEVFSEEHLLQSVAVLEELSLWSRANFT